MTTTTDLQKLLAEATKGPWVWDKFAEFSSPKFSLGPGVLLTDERDGTPWGDTIDQANARLIAMAPDLAARVIELEAENVRLRGYIEGMIPEMEKFNQRGCGRNCYMEGDWFDVSEARTALKGGEK